MLVSYGHCDSIIKVVLYEKTQTFVNKFESQNKVWQLNGDVVASRHFSQFFKTKSTRKTTVKSQDKDT